MRNIYIVFITVVLSCPGFSQNVFNYKISKLYCVLNFMQTASGSYGTSSTFKEYIDNQMKNDVDFNNLVADFSKLNIHNLISREGFPESRKQNNSTYDLIIANAVNSSNFDEFKTKCLGLIPFETNQKLNAILKEAEKHYDRIVWIEHKEKLEKHLLELSKFEKVNSTIFNKIRAFYDSSWTADVPFQVALYPIPGTNGYSTATPHVNSLCVAIFADESDYVSRNSVVLHEMCHILYKEQGLKRQYEIEGYFNDNKTLYSRLAYSYIDEALATAIGNGWAYKEINKKIDDKEWYADKTINKFAKLIYPKVEEYMQRNKAIDRELVDEAIKIFSKNFPKAIQEYSTILNETIVYSDEMLEIEAVNALGEFFQVYSLDLFSPILSKISLQAMESSKQTQLLIIHKNQQQTLDEIKKIFPQVDEFKFKNKTMNLSFFDLKSRAVIVLVLNDITELKPELLKMKRLGVFDIRSPLQY